MKDFDSIKTIQMILRKKGYGNLANLLNNSWGNIEESSNYGSYLYSIISTYEINSPLDNYLKLKELSETDRNIILEAVLDVYPPKDNSPEIRELFFRFDKDINPLEEETYEISEITKNELFDALKINKISWYGKFREINFLERIFDLDNLPSTDFRYSTAKEDIIKHTVANDDWESDWILYDDRFKIINGSDQTFTRFICEMLNPAVRTNEQEVNQLVSLFNSILDNDNWELYISKKISNKPIYSARKKSYKVEEKIIFKVINFSKYQPSSKEANTCLLMRDNWDDFGYKTTFHLFYADKNKKIQDLGLISVMKRGMGLGYVDMPTMFEYLSDEYCSLGSSQEYYEELMRLSSFTRNKILTGLRDCVFNQDIFTSFMNEEVMEKSLLRAITSRNVKETFRNILLGNAKLTPFNVTFSLEEQELIIDISVIPESTPPTNVHVLIGRNGVGKTRILAGIAHALTENSDNDNGFVIKGKIDFIGEDDESGRFANLVVVAFSVFDRFEPIPNENVSEKIRYSYIGLKKNNNQSDFKNIDELNSEFEKSLIDCFKGVKKKRWIDAIRILNSDPCFEELELENKATIPEDNINLIFEAYKYLSSGHKVVLLTITRLVQLVDDRTLVLIDELETHLHPPLLASFIRALSNLLIQRNGVAIIATHSPVVLQEVPSSCVSIIDRSGSSISIKRSSIETFGENIGTITRDIFNLEVVKSGFLKMLSNELLETASYEKIITKFNNQIGSEGKAILRALILNEKEEN